MLLNGDHVSLYISNFSIDWIFNIVQTISSFSQCSGGPVDELLYLVIYVITRFEDEAYVMDITNAHIDGSATTLGGSAIMEPQVSFAIGLHANGALLPLCSVFISCLSVNQSAIAGDWFEEIPGIAANYLSRIQWVCWNKILEFLFQTLSGRYTRPSISEPSPPTAPP